MTPYQTRLTGAAGCRWTERNSLDFASLLLVAMDKTGIKCRDQSSAEVKRVLFV